MGLRASQRHSGRVKKPTTHHQVLKYLIGQNFRHQAQILTLLSDFCLTFVLKYWTKFSTDKIFDTKPNFRQFCPTKFCPIRYPYKFQRRSLMSPKSKKRLRYAFLNFVRQFQIDESTILKRGFSIEIGQQFQQYQNVKTFSEYFYRKILMILLVNACFFISENLV